MPEHPSSTESAAVRHSTLLTERLRDRIEARDGIPFVDFMQAALYEPGLGYYSAGAWKLGRGGDFTTAPELSALFSRCLARQSAELLAELDEAADVMEFGGGSGAMAAAVLAELALLDRLPGNYFLVEVSADLRQRQRDTLKRLVPEHLHRVRWLDGPPADGFVGVVLANELLDALPVHRFAVRGGRVLESVVHVRDGAFRESFESPRSAGLESAVRELGELPDGLESEIGLYGRAWVRGLGEYLRRGAALIVDYGYPRADYYHPERSSGTLMCYYHHQALEDPFVHLGLQDITAHVDFTAVAEAALGAGLGLAGYTNQANFLLGSGLLALAEEGGDDPALMMDIASQIKQLTLPQAMGERFKVLGVYRGLERPWRGFSLRDQRGAL